MPVRAVLVRYASADAARPVDEREGELERIPEAGATLWRREPYTVRRVDPGPPPRVELTLDAELWLRATGPLPPSHTLDVRLAADGAGHEATVLNLKGSIRGHGRGADPEEAIRAALRDARMAG